MSYIQERSIHTGEVNTFRTDHSRIVFKLAEFEAGVVHVERDCDEFAWVDKKMKTHVSHFEFKQILTTGGFGFLRAAPDGGSVQSELEVALHRQAAQLNATFSTVRMRDLQVKPIATKNKLVAHSYLASLYGTDLSQYEGQICSWLKPDQTETPRSIAKALGLNVHMTITACVKLWRSGRVHPLLDTAAIGANWKVSGAAHEN